MDSIANILTPNIRCKVNARMKEVDNSPLHVELFGKIGEGPIRMNFVIPKALANILVANASKGIRETCWLKSPCSLEGVNP